MAQLEVSGIVHRYGSHTVVDGVSFGVDSGTIACLLGPSGCGKTTLLRCIAGFEDLAGGEIRLQGRRVSSPGRRLPPERRQIGMVFQDYALFPHLSVEANVGFGLAGLSGDERRRRVGDLLQTVGLSGQGQRYPHELSGGQQQRVALARALAPRPQLILLDEPFSNLDVDLRERLSLEVREILRSQGITAVLVTHDQHEAFAMADEVGVMAGGTIQQWDTPYRVYHEPANRFVADFVGQGVFLPGVVLDERRVEIELGVLQSRLPLECSPGCAACGKGCGVEVLLRPDDVVHDDRATLSGEVRSKAFRGAEILYTLRLQSGVEVLSLVPSHHDHAIGEMIGIRLDVDHVVAFRSTAPEPRGSARAIRLHR
ncbi:ABC transporter ATP-binding protein [Accumulibacter sp.]|uniref:ABC transporter ATP-binding protein n=1 Tax=Accumulibacter sp. TaxID=2053492 RepID=UPI0025F2C884|nr:ABC transporter ATP-binding protein [Accumulibacter sp.]MCM8596326.1 ABC transporter ATP-binding protein [Accumulibacter sp.]MCM8627460.1 ABC transporter ATP-binding protein [Accumulibacter sp.]MDS4050475.1 ABC transporter ATP-binding protein [Accumulibacter sp.]